MLSGPTFVGAFLVRGSRIADVPASDHGIFRQRIDWGEAQDIRWTWIEGVVGPGPVLEFAMGIRGQAVPAGRLAGLVAAEVATERPLQLDLAGLGDPDPLQQALVWLVLGLGHGSYPDREG